ncbi:MAG TPA: chemotaxis protein CheW [Rhodanobacteraceae bacterium]|nr:chemotaxis protein CheW [Rhodanobacteraceae bacterium]
MSVVNERKKSTPFETLADYERRSLAHVAGAPEQADTGVAWRGIGYRVGAHYLLSSIAEVSEILSLPPLTPVPGTRSWLLGVGNVRGNLVPVIDLLGFIEGVPSDRTEESRMLVVRHHADGIGLLIDEVLGQRSFSDEQRSQAVGEEDQRYARFVGEKINLGGVFWGVFSMASLVRAADFQQAAA